MAPEEAPGGGPVEQRPAYLKPRERPAWLRTGRLLGEHGAAETHGDLRRFAKGMENRRAAACVAASRAALGESWRIGTEDFAAWLADQLGRRGAAIERARERRETDKQMAERLAAERWDTRRLATPPKGHPVKVALAASSGNTPR